MTRHIYRRHRITNDADQDISQSHMLEDQQPHSEPTGKESIFGNSHGSTPGAEHNTTASRISDQDDDLVRNIEDVLTGQSLRSGQMGGNSPVKMDSDHHGKGGKRRTTSRFSTELDVEYAIQESIQKARERKEAEERAQRECGSTTDAKPEPQSRAHCEVPSMPGNTSDEGTSAVKTVWYCVSASSIPRILVCVI